MTTDSTCEQCGKPFSVAPAVLARYPGWRPRRCLACSGRSPKPPRQDSAAGDLDPQTGIFTDGACDPNPGPGGWGAVKVVDGRVVDERSGHEPWTTNNRMELTALIAGYEMAGGDEPLTVWTDSELCYNTITKWAPAWERSGWKRKTGEIKNLDLVRKLYDMSRRQPNVTLKWIKGHSVSRWNDYADQLSTAYRRSR